MAADLHIHVLEGATEEDVAILNSHTLGSRFFDWKRATARIPDEVYDRIGKTPQIWIGEVSWLKAALLEDHETFIPPAVDTINELVDEYFPLLTPELRDSILAALDGDNPTAYRLADRGDVQKFLDEHMGKPLFAVSW